MTQNTVAPGGSFQEPSITLEMAFALLEGWMAGAPNRYWDLRRPRGKKTYELQLWEGRNAVGRGIGRDVETAVSKALYGD